MAIKNKNGLLVSYPCEELIQDISEDIFLFGEDYKVYAVLQFFGTVDGRILDVDFKELLEKLLLQNSII